MQLMNLPLEQACGAILVHNVAGADGRKALDKGRVVTAQDLDTLRALGKRSVYVAVLDPADVREDDAATQLARVLAGDGIALTPAHGGRVNWLAGQAGFVRINRDALRRVNELPGVTLATLARYAPVAPQKIAATLKTIGLALPKTTIREAEKIVGARGRVVSIAPRVIENVALVLTGSARGRARTQDTFLPPLQARIAELGARVIADAFVEEDADALAVTLVGVLGAGAQLVLIAGETSIMDADDITPRGIRQAGGVIEVFGAPVEPGNLLLLAYIGNVPVIGAPGCVKSRAPNGVDLILPPLLIGERVTRADVIALAEGGLFPNSKSET